MSKRSALIIGASGVVGVPLCLTLRQRGWRVHGAARFTNPDRKQLLVDGDVAPVVFDIHHDDPAILPDVDVVILEIWDRTLSWDDPQDAAMQWALNFDAVARVVERYAGRADIVNGSTISLYGPRVDRPSRESDLPAPDTQYGLARLAQEKMIDYFAASRGSRAVHLRYARSNTPKFGVIRHMADAIGRGDSLGADPDQRTQVIGLDDFVRCTADAADRIDDMPPHINIVHPHIWRQRELADRIQAAMGTGVVHFDHEAGGARTSTWADPSLMMRIFGSPQQDLDALIDQTAASAVADD
jgi:nucleoside-diphosphate-sugar epimerase